MASPATGAARARASRLRRAKRTRTLSRREREWLDTYERTHGGPSQSRTRTSPASRPERANLEPPDAPPVESPIDEPPTSIGDSFVDPASDDPPPPAAVASDWQVPDRVYPALPSGDPFVPPPDDDAPAAPSSSPGPSASPGDPPKAEAKHDDACPYGAAVSTCAGCGKKYIPISREEARQIAQHGIPVVAKAIATADYMTKHQGQRPPAMHVELSADEIALAGDALRPLLARLAVFGPILQIGGAIAVLSAVSAQAALRAHPQGECASCKPE